MNIPVLDFGGNMAQDSTGYAQVRGSNYIVTNVFGRHVVECAVNSCLCRMSGSICTICKRAICSKAAHVCVQGLHSTRIPGSPPQ